MLVFQQIVEQDADTQYLGIYHNTLECTVYCI